jgi:CubicO group peptidase (beta-lactamase class C family)
MKRGLYGMMFTKYVLISTLLMTNILILNSCSNQNLTTNNQSEVTSIITEHTPWPDQQWDRSSLDQQGIDSTIIKQLDEYISKYHYKVDSLLIVRNGYLVKDNYANSYDSKTRHQIYSVTKSIISALVGIALEEGKIQSIDQPIADYFPEMMNDTSITKKSITIKHLLTMTSGFNWPELAIPYTSSENPLVQMYESPNQVKFILERELSKEPGEFYNYSSADSHLLSAIVQLAVGKTTEQYAREKLFKPIGITDIEWPSDEQGISLGGAGLFLLPVDMARFGYLYLRNGMWEDQQIIPSAWVEQSTILQASGMFKYGYLWRIGDEGDYYAMGYRGQFILISPKLDLVVVFTGDLEDEFMPLIQFNQLKKAVDNIQFSSNNIR